MVEIVAMAGPSDSRSSGDTGEGELTIRDQSEGHTTRELNMSCRWYVQVS